MKKIVFCSLLASLGCFATNATVYRIEVSNYQFTPATLDAIVGDTITWFWSEGNHTTTSTGVPIGAAVWDAPINSTDTTFTYVLAIPGTYQYWCTFHQPNMAGSIIASSSLPVQLTNFSVTSTSGNKALLSWSTLTEQNTSYFSIKRSIDASNFSEIARVDAAGNSASLINYSYTDNDISSNTKYFYYSIEIIDKDDKKQLSTIKMFNNLSAKSKLITSISPNPVSNPGHLALQFNAEKDGKMLVQLYDANGRFVKQTEMDAHEGLNNGHFHLGNLPAGMYNLVFTLDNLKEKKSIILK